METGWPPPVLLVTVIMAKGIFSVPCSAMQARSASTSMLPLNGRLDLGVEGFAAGQVEGDGAAVLDVGPGGVEVAVVGNDVARFEHARGEDPLGGATLVGREDVLHPGDLGDARLEALPRPAAGVALVAEHHRRPLLGGHGAGARVGEQIDAAVLGVEEEDVVVGRLQGRLPVGRGW